MADLIHEAGGLVYMDGANMNAIAGWIDLDKMGVDAVHNNLHKTWTIPHGGGGPGDGIVAVSHRLVDYFQGFRFSKTAKNLIWLKLQRPLVHFTVTTEISHIKCARTLISKRLVDQVFVKCRELLFCSEIFVRKIKTYIPKSSGRM
jgi:glycine cleavage system protein P-like pyridoxal-binding family